MPSGRTDTEVGFPGTGIVALTVPVARSMRVTELPALFATYAKPPTLGIEIPVGDAPTGMVD